jgi:hypothetical protein
MHKLRYGLCGSSAHQTGVHQRLSPNRQHMLLVKDAKQLGWAVHSAGPPPPSGKPSDINAVPNLVHVILKG